LHRFDPACAWLLIALKAVCSAPVISRFGLCASGLSEQFNMMSRIARDGLNLPMMSSGLVRKNEYVLSSGSISSRLLGPRPQSATTSSLAMVQYLVL